MTNLHENKAADVTRGQQRLRLPRGDGPWSVNTDCVDEQGLGDLSQ